jgi:hypothetical protein
MPVSCCRRQPRPGYVVLAGTALGLYPVGEGDHVVVAFNGVAATDCRVS